MLSETIFLDGKFWTVESAAMIVAAGNWFSRYHVEINGARCPVWVQCVKESGGYLVRWFDSADSLRAMARVQI